MSRFGRERRTFFFEEPVREDVRAPFLRVNSCEQSGVSVCTPVFPNDLPAEESVSAQRVLVDRLLGERGVSRPVAWYYTPMAREFSRHIEAGATVYDCMDELSAFAGAPPAMKANEQDLFAQADLVFTGGESLYQAKRKQHARVHCFPSSVDMRHFAQARQPQSEPEDQAGIPHPRLGYAGVIDERMDAELLRSVAGQRPNWHFVMLGPVVKIDPASLPQAPNLHYLGMKTYSELPAYFSGWRIGMLPFALNEATRYISPTKTPEYLAAGLRVISTAIRDVVQPYGVSGLAEIAEDASGFISVAEKLLSSPQIDGFRVRADAFLAKSSWERTWQEMNALVDAAYRKVQRHGDELRREEGAYV
jgi:UDP-galactopyranose mutase